MTVLSMSPRHINLYVRAIQINYEGCMPSFIAIDLVFGVLLAILLTSILLQGGSVALSTKTASAVQRMKMSVVQIIVALVVTN